MTSSPVVSVRGESRLEVEPEQAVVSLTASVQERTRDEVLRTLSDRRQDVADVLERFTEAIENTEDGGLQVYPRFDPENSDRVVRYGGRTTYTVTVRDFAVLSDLIVAASTASLEVSGPFWRLRPDSEVYRRARTGAVGDAVRRAREYAGAFGAEVVSLVEVADRGLSTAGTAAAPMAMVTRTMVAPGAQSAPTFDLAPVRQHVTGEIEARFLISEPDLDRPGQGS